MCRNQAWPQCAGTTSRNDCFTVEGRVETLGKQIHKGKAQIKKEHGGGVVGINAGPRVRKVTKKGTHLFTKGDQSGQGRQSEMQ